MPSHDVVTFLLSLGGILFLARFFAEAARKCKLPIVMGEILLGILLGPTVFGHLFPAQFAVIFPQEGAEPIVWSGITQLAVVMLLFVSGLEIQLHLVLKQGRTAAFTSITSMIIPCLLGFVTVWLFPQFFVVGKTNKVLYALFFGVAMAISAVPVIARILMDLDLYRSKIGTIIMSAAISDDILGWLLFSSILGLMGLKSEITSIWQTLAMIVGFALFMLVVGKRIINMALPWAQTKLSWPGGVLSLCLSLGFLGAAFTEFIGLHAILGAFITAIAIGDSPRLRNEVREIIGQFVTNIFAPIFFVSIGLKVNFIHDFDLSLVLIVLFLACFCKVLGATLGAMMGGLKGREALAVGFGLNARGAMEIILGRLALDYGVIDSKMYVALVIMALVTSIISAPLLRIFAHQSKLADDKRRYTRAHAAAGYHQTFQP